MSADILKVAQLDRNPFSLLPRQKVPIWVGDHSVLERILHIVRPKRASEFTVLHGDYGTGKSHTLQYLHYLIEDGAPEDYSSVVVYIPSIRLGQKTESWSLARRIIMDLGQSTVAERCKPLVDFIAGTAAVRYGEMIREKSPKEIDSMAQTQAEDRWRIKMELASEYCSPSAELFGPLEELAEETGGAANAWAALTDPSSKAGSVWGLEPMGNDYEAIRVLASLVNFMTYDEPNAPNTPGSRMFYIFIDEAEMTMTLPAKEQVSINWGLRDLLNYCPERLCLLMAATGAAADLYGIFTDAVHQRWTRSPVELGELDADQAYQFVVELLEKYRTQAPPIPTHPFTEEATRLIVERTASKTPRRLMRNFGVAFELAARDGGPLATKGLIGVDDIDVGELT